MKQFQDEDHQLQDCDTLSTYKGSDSSRTSVSGKSYAVISVNSIDKSIEKKVIDSMHNGHHINNLKNLRQGKKNLS